MLGCSDVALVTGGTGVTGRVLVRKLCATGCRVRVCVRPSSDRSVLDGLPVEWFEGDVFDADVTAAAAKDVDYIFHVAAAYRDARLTAADQTLVHVRSTQLLAKAAHCNPRFKRFVHVSTVGVLGHIARPPADETSPYNPGDSYQQSKAEGERWLLQFAESHGLPLVVVRPAAIYGPGDRRLLKAFRMARLRVVPLLGSNRGLYHLIHIEDLVDFLMLVAHHPRALGEVFICGNPSAITIQEMIATVAEHLGRKPRFVRIPAWPVFLAADICEVLCRPFGIEPPIHRRRVAFFTKDRSFDTTKMRRLTGFECRYSNVTGLIETAEWYQANGWL